MDTNEPSGQRHLTSNAEDDQSLTQIREILFGDHRRQTRQQIAALEARLDEWDTAFRQMLDQRIHQALEDLKRLEEQTKAHSVALGQLGPPQLSKLLWDKKEERGEAALNYSVKVEKQSV